MSGHMVAFVAVAVLLLVPFALRRKRQVAPEPEVVYVPPTPPVSALDPEVYELVASGIPDDYIDDYVATKRQSWLGRNKYKVAGTVLGSGALGLAYWQRHIRKRDLREKHAALGRDLDEAFRELGGRNPFEDEDEDSSDFREVFLRPR